MTGRLRALTMAAASLTLVVSAACSRDSGSRDAFCDQVKVVPPLASVISGFTEADPEELDARLEEARGSYEDLRTAAPDEISDDVSAMVDLVDAVITTVKANEGDPEAIADQIRAAMKDHKGAAEASAAVSGYAERTCNVRLD